MLNRAIPWRVAVLIFGLIGSSIGAGAEPYDLRGIRLGITLPEFRKMSHPDGNRAIVMCSNDANYPLFFYAGKDEKDAGVLFCGFVENGEEAHLNVATVSAFTVEYKFVADFTRKNVPALYEITVSSNVMHWNKFWEGYNGKYGKPHRVSNAPTQTQMGAKLDNVEAVWDNQESTIRLVKRLGRIDHTYIFYEHRRLAAEVKRRARSKTGKPSDKL